MINAIILRHIKSLRGFYQDTMQDGKAQEHERFQFAYNFRAPELFAVARYKTVQNFLENVPENLLKKYLEKLPTYFSWKYKSTRKYTKNDQENLWTYIRAEIQSTMVIDWQQANRTL